MPEVTVEDIERGVDVILKKIDGAGKAELEEQGNKLGAFLAWFQTQDRDRCRVMNKILNAQQKIFLRKHDLK